MRRTGPGVVHLHTTEEERSDLHGTLLLFIDSTSALKSAQEGTADRRRKIITDGSQPFCDRSDRQKSRTPRSMTGSLSLHGKLIQSDVFFQA